MQSGSPAIANDEDPATDFDATFMRLAPGFMIRPEVEGDRFFLIELFCACSPLAASLPRLLLESQAGLQIDAHSASHPGGMRRIVEDREGPIGRIFLDWAGAGSVHGVDIAILPDRRRGAAGFALLRTWLQVADAINRPTRLEVRYDNPARTLYRRLGFREIDDGPMVSMERSPRDG